MNINTSSPPTHAPVEAFYNFVDAFKAVPGIQPRWYRPEDDTAMIDRLVEEGQEMVRREREEEAAHQAWVAEVTACRPLKVPLAAFVAR